MTEECELIIIDGGSTDTTNDIINSYMKYIAYTVSERDKGIYDAWNKGIKKSGGKWVAFIGADDILCDGVINDYLEILHNKKNIEEIDYICAQMELINQNGKSTKIFGSAPVWSSMRYGMCAAHPMSLHNKNRLFDMYGLYNLDYKICADYEMLLRKKNSLTYIFIPKVVVKMQIGGTSFSERGVYEAFRIRRDKKTISLLENIYKYIGTVLGLKTYQFRHRFNLKK